MAETLARFQFAATSIYHFLFVPLTIGLAFLVALLETSWYRRGDPDTLRLTRFFGTLLVINVAIGVVTGLIQEFEFGMNWSVYSTEVGNIFGGPLAMEGLAAFFLESTFLGIWIFGWGRISRRAHLTCIWLVSVGTMLSAAFIMAANSWMQHPVGYVMNPTTHQPELNNIVALFTNPVFRWGFVHVILASLVTGSTVMLAVSAWQLRRRGDAGRPFERTARLALVVLLPSIFVAMFVGSELGVVEGTYQPMKIAAAEALWNTCPSHCPFSVFQVGGGKDDMTPTKLIEVPDLLSILATNHLDGEVLGLHQLQAQDVAAYGPGDYIPNVFIQYWSMRVMAYLATIVLVVSIWGLWLVRRKRLARARVFLAVAPWFAAVPLLINTAGWMLTENGRQPWIVQGLLLTKAGVSPGVTETDLWISLVAFLAVFAVLALVDAWLMVRFGRHELPPEREEAGEDEDEDHDVPAGLVY